MLTKNKRAYRLLLIALLAAALLAGAYLAGERWRLEAGNKQVEVTVEYGQVQLLARQEKRPLAEVLLTLRQAGATGILFKEQLLSEIEEEGLWRARGSELLLNPLFRQLWPELVPRDTYLVTRDVRLAARLEEQLRLKGGQPRRLQAGDAYLVGTDLAPGVLSILGFGFPAAAVDAARAAGLDILLQVRTWPRARPPQVADYFATLEAVPGVTGLLFNDYDLPGYPKSLPALVAAVDRLGAPLGLIEFHPQRGLDRLVLATGKQAVRLHSIGADEMVDMNQGAALDRFSLAVRERDIRVIVIRFFMKPESQSWLADNRAYLEKLTGELAAAGFTTGPARPFGALPYSRLLLWLAGLGPAAGLALLLDHLRYRRLGLVAALLAILAWSGLLYLGQVTLARQAMALAAAIVFPTLGLTLAWRRQPRGLAAAVAAWLGATAVSLAGAILVAGLLADVGFMLKLSQFAGVKLALVAPLILLAAIYAWKAEGRRLPARLKDLWQHPITVGWAAAAVVLAVVAVVYVSRTGNDNALVSGWELQLRNVLDHILGVRPRTKEFLIGYPLTILSLYLGYEHRWLPLWLLGAIGQVSLVNTFAHIHTPLLVSLARTFNGLWLGLLVGVVLVLAWRWVAARWGRWLA